MLKVSNLHGFNAASSSEKDPYWGNVVLLVAPGTDNANDSSLIKAIPTVSTGTISTSITPGATWPASLYGNGSTQFSYPIAPIWPFVSGHAWTIEFWIRFSDVSVTRYFFGDSTSGSSYFFVSGGNLGYVNSVSIPLGTVSANTWYHIAVSYTGSVYSAYKNGVRTATGSKAISKTYSSSSFALFNVGVGSYFYGHMTDVRITKDISRYSGATIDIPTGPFPTQ